MQYDTKNRLGQVIDRLCDELRIKSRSQLWEYADVDRHLWYRLLRSTTKQSPTPDNIAELVNNLRERDYRVSPAVEKSLYEAIGVAVRQDEPDGIVPTPPPAPDYFGGRESLLARLKGQLKGAQLVKILSLHGLGGIGKTTLARQLAHDLFYKEKEFGAVLWAEVTRQPDPLNILLNWAFFANPHFMYTNQSLPQLAMQVKASLEKLLARQTASRASTRVLVVLDDVWDGGKECVRLLRQACPADSRILLTTRSENLAIELSGPNVESVERLDQAEGIRLLQLYLPQSDPALLGELSGTLGGHPLALSLAARRALKKTNTARALLEHSEQYRHGLSSGRSFAELEIEWGTSRDDNLSVVFSHSYTALSPQGRQCFRALGVLAYDQPFDAALLAALWQLEETEAEKITDELRLAALLESINGPGEDWFRQHALLQAYARSLLAEDDRQKEFFDRYTGHVIRLAAKFKELPVEKWGELRPYLVHVHTVGDRLAEQMAVLPASAGYLPLEVETANKSLLEQTARFARNASYYLDRYGEVHQANWLEAGLKAGRWLNDKATEAHILRYTARERAGRGYLNEALEICQQSLVLCQELGDWNEVTDCLANLCHYYSQLEEKQKALEYGMRVLTLVKELNNKRAEAEAHNIVGIAYAGLDDFKTALDYFLKALPAARMYNERSNEVLCLGNIGWAYGNLGDLATGLPYYMQALDFHRQVGDLVSQWGTLCNIGYDHANANQPEKALTYFLEALELNHQVGDILSEAVTFGFIGRVYVDLGQPKRGLEYFEKALARSREAGSRNREAASLYRIGKIHEQFGDLPLALKHIEEAVRVNEGSDHSPEKARRIFDLSNLYRQQGRMEEAYSYMERCLEVAEAINHPDKEKYRLSLADLKKRLISL